MADILCFTNSCDGNFQFPFRSLNVQLLLNTVLGADRLIFDGEVVQIP